MHPIIAQRGVELLSPPGGTVLDPFCGSGTVLVESRLAGRKSWGVDLNPLAVLLAKLKSQSATSTQLQKTVDAARKIAQHADTRRREKRGATMRYCDEDVQLFDPHVLLELDGLRDALQMEHDAFVFNALRLVLSSILVKVSRKPGDSSTTQVPRRLASGFTITLFERKTIELAERMDAFRKRLPPRSPIAQVHSGDARLLESIPNASIHLVLSSPPYAGTYDYAEQHRLRLRWLDLPDSDMQRNEVGARRHTRHLHPSDAIRRYEDDLVHVLRAAKTKLLPNGTVVFLIADSVIGSQPVWAEPLIRRCGEKAGLSWQASASQRRPHFHHHSRHAFEEHPRREHLVLLSSTAR
jgi:DNA modification methylase